MREPDEANHTESVSDIITSMGCKLAIRDVTHHFKKECTSSSNERSLSLLFKRVVIKVTVMKKIHKKSAPALMNLI